MALLASLLFLTEGMQAKITLPAFFSDGMVLQQQSSVAIWGNSDKKKQKVTIKTSWNQKKCATITDELGQCSECGKTWQAYPGNLLRGSSCKSCKFKNTVRQRSKKIRCITTGEIFNTFKEAAEKYNISCSTICLCCNDSSKHKHAGGLEWEYTIL